METFVLNFMELFQVLLYLLPSWTYQCVCCALRNHEFHLKNDGRRCSCSATILPRANVHAHRCGRVGKNSVCDACFRACVMPQNADLRASKESLFQSGSHFSQVMWLMHPGWSFYTQAWLSISAGLLRSYECVCNRFLSSTSSFKKKVLCWKV